MGIQDLEDSVVALEDWLKPQFLGRRSVFVDPPKIQKELSISEPVFWYCIFALRERQVIGFEEKGKLGLYPASIIIKEAEC